MAKNKSKRKRAKLKRADYRRGGNVKDMRMRENDPNVSIPSKNPPVRREPVKTPPPSAVPIASGPGFTTGTDANVQASYATSNMAGLGAGLGFPGQNNNFNDYYDYNENGGGQDDGDDGRGEPTAPPNGQAEIVINGQIYRWNGYTYVPTGESAGGGNDGGGNDGGGNDGGGNDGGGDEPPPDPLEVATDAQNRATFESERRIRNVRTGREAKDIASGNIPTGTIPVPVVSGIGREGTEITDEEVQEITAPTPTTPSTIDQVPDETVTRMGDVATIDPAREVRPDTVTAKTLDRAATVSAAQEDEIRLAEAANVADAPLVADVDVEVATGSVAPVVTGELSPDAKARIVENTGTDLARITRAKKQLANAGVSEEAVEELGNDPENLEARLADFSEEERGIIEGLPQEALVSNQLDSLLSGIEEGEIPTWARPAVSTVEAMLAKRGLQASSIARDALANTIIQASLPLAQANAQAIQASVAQQRNIEAAVNEANAQREQQTVLKNAEQVFGMDMANMAAEQQTALANSKFFQTVSLTEANQDQQQAVQNAVMKAQENIADADMFQKAQIENAKLFLAQNMANLSNRQQANVIKGQYEQQRLLTNQSAQNAMRQFNATSDLQAQQFMAQIETQIRQYNAGYINASEQFNAQSANAAAARDAQRVADVNRANAAILNQVEQFNAQQQFQVSQWNAANAQAIINSNVDWRRRANTADTAALNAVNQQNAQNAFGLTQAAQSFLWQELRDQADYDFRWSTDTANRKVQAMMAAASAEGDAAKNWGTNFANASSRIDNMFGSGGGDY